MTQEPIESVEKHRRYERSKFGRSLVQVSAAVWSDRSKFQSFVSASFVGRFRRFRSRFARDAALFIFPLTPETPWGNISNTRTTATVSCRSAACGSWCCSSSSPRGSGCTSGRRRGACLTWKRRFTAWHMGKLKRYLHVPQFVGYCVRRGQTFIFDDRATSMGVAHGPELGQAQGVALLRRVVAANGLPENYFTRYQVIPFEKGVFGGMNRSEHLRTNI